MKSKSTVIPSIDQTISVLKEHGYSDKKITSLIESGRKAFGKFIKNDDMLAMMITKNLGIEVEVKSLKSKEKLSKMDISNKWTEYLKFQEKVMKLEGKVSEDFIKKWIELISNDKELKKLMVK